MIDSSIEEAKLQAQNRIDRAKGYDLKDAENGWKSHELRHRSGITGKRRYAFVKYFDNPVKVEFKDKWGNPMTGFAYCVHYDTEYSVRSHFRNKEKYPHGYDTFSLSFSCIAAQSGGNFILGKVEIGGHIRILSGTYRKILSRAMNITPPNAYDFEKYPRD